MLDILFAIFAIGYFYDQIPMNEPLKTIGNVIFIVLILLVAFGLPHIAVVR